MTGSIWFGKRKDRLMSFSLVESSRLVSCPKIIKTLQQTLDDARSNELITFKKMAKINDMTEYETVEIQFKVYHCILERCLKFDPMMISFRIIINLLNKWPIY